MGGERTTDRARGKWIKALRRRLGISQAKLGELLDTHGNEISYYERGARDPSGPRRRLLLMIQRALENAPREAVYPAQELTVDQRWRMIVLAGTTPVQLELGKERAA